VPESLKFCLENLLGNIGLFLPLGVMLPLIFDKASSLQRVLAIGMSASLVIEVTQFFSRYFGIYRSVDIDDVLLNTMGACLGYICFVVVRRYAYEDK
jgi:glycopeptide antibiotics resistance protein